MTTYYILLEIYFKQRYIVVYITNKSQLIYGMFIYNHLVIKYTLHPTKTGSVPPFIQNINNPNC